MGLDAADAVDTHFLVDEVGEGMVQLATLEIFHERPLGVPFVGQSSGIVKCGKR
jgi:hypothetical protein